MPMRFVRRTVVLICACLLIVLAGLVAVWNVRLPTSFFGPEYSWLADPAVQSRELRAALFENELSLSKDTATLARHSARSNPLGDDGFVLAALESREGGRYHAALGVLEIARKRDPRNRVSRVLLVDGYLREARARELVTEAIALEQLRAGTGAIFVPVMADLARQPSTRADTIDALGETPLAMQLMRALAKERSEPQLLLEFAFARSQRPDRSGSRRATIAGLITPYLEAGDTRAAQRIWSHFYSGEDPRTLTDPELTGDPGPPFGWTLTKAKGGLAEFSDEGLQVADFGRGRWVAARAVMLLPPGPYRLMDEIEQGTEGGPSLAWEVACIAGGQTLLNLPFSREGFLGMTPSETFVVPDAGCDAQSLVLVGTGEGRSGTRSVTIRSVEIVPL